MVVSKLTENDLLVPPFIVGCLQPNNMGWQTGLGLAHALPLSLSLSFFHSPSARSFIPASQFFYSALLLSRYTSRKRDSN